MSHKVMLYNQICKGAFINTLVGGGGAGQNGGGGQKSFELPEGGDQKVFLSKGGGVKKVWSNWKYNENQNAQFVAKINRI